MNSAHEHVARTYGMALRDALGGAGEAVLKQAYEVGRQAMVDGVDLVDFFSIHHDAVTEIVQRLAGGDEVLRVLAVSRDFFVESLSAFELSLRNFREANTALHHLNQMLETEAKRIAQALHDEAGQLLVSVHLALEAATHRLPAATRSELDSVRTLLDDMEKQLRRLSHELRPPVLDHLGLLPAIEFLAEGIAARGKLEIGVSGDIGRLPLGLETTLYRVVQEGLSNVARHAGATRAKVELGRQPDRVLLTVRDNGIGFDTDNSSKPAAGGLGLLGIRERLLAWGGTVEIQSSRQRGTELRVEVPLEVST